MRRSDLSPAEIKRLREIDDKRVEVLEKFEKDPFLGYENIEEAYDDYKVTSNVEVLARMLNKENLFISGPAGSGKTTIINKFIELLDAETKGNAKVALTASTGIAAQLIGGRTIHSWSGLGIMTEPFNEKKIPPYIWPRWKDIKETEVLIIDEISMLPAYFFENLDSMMKWARKNNKPFGGVQLIVSGDFQQLPPVDRNPKIDNSFAITTKAWKEADITYCFLDKTLRATDNKLKYILEMISRDKVDDKVIALLNSRIEAEMDEDKTYTTLFTTNRNVDKFNEERLAEIDAPLVRFRAKTSGLKKNVDKLYKQNNLPEILDMKKGATIILTSNIKTDVGVLPNGSIGKIIRFDKNLPVVKLNTGKTATIYPQKYVLEEEETVFDPALKKDVKIKKVLASISQLPLKSGFAITVHKSQGQTFDGVVADLSQCFTPGLGYVALSRVNSLDDLVISSFNDKALEVDENARNISNFIKKKAIEGRKEFKEDEDEYTSLLKYSLYRKMNWD